MANECAHYLSQKFPKVKTKPALILENNFSSQGAEVALFVDYLEQENPDFVVMATHGRSGWTRTFLGSFAESLLLQSRFPTIMIGPDCGEVKALKSGLMPIPLGESSQRFLEKFLDDHRLAFLEKLTLFHKISMVDIEEVAWAPSLFGLTDFSTGDLLTKAKETTEKYLKAFLDHPLSQKRLNYKISESLEPVADVIVEEAKGYDVTVMETQCGSLEATLIGSVARDVIRRSKNPVVVYPHKFQDWVTQ